MRVRVASRRDGNRQLTMTRRNRPAASRDMGLGARSLPLGPASRREPRPIPRLTMSLSLHKGRQAPGVRQRTSTRTSPTTPVTAMTTDSSGDSSMIRSTTWWPAAFPRTPVVFGVPMREPAPPPCWQPPWPAPAPRLHRLLRRGTGRHGGRPSGRHRSTPFGPTPSRNSPSTWTAPGTTTFGDSDLHGHAALQKPDIPMTQDPPATRSPSTTRALRPRQENDQPGGVGPHTDRRLPFRPRRHRLHGS